MYELLLHFITVIKIKNKNIKNFQKYQKLQRQFPFIASTFIGEISVNSI